MQSVRASRGRCLIDGVAGANGRRLFRVVLPVVVSVVIIGWLVVVVGVDPFLVAARSLSPLSIVVALLAGVAATVIQAERWRLVSQGFGIDLGFVEASARCWQASFVNSVLPGGLAGDALRTVEQRGRSGASWRGSIGSVLGERLIATVVTLSAAAIALVSRAPWLAAAVGGAAVVVAAIVWPAFRRLAWRARFASVVLSVAGWIIFVALFAVAAVTTAAAEREAVIEGLDLGQMTPEALGAWAIVGLAALSLAGMSIPLSWGGWGPREGVAAFSFVLYGYSAEQGVAVAVAYGLLALVSVLPGGAVMVARLILAAAETRRQPLGETPGGH